MSPIFEIRTKYVHIRTTWFTDEVRQNQLAPWRGFAEEHAPFASGVGLAVVHRATRFASDVGAFAIKMLRHKLLLKPWTTILSADPASVPWNSSDSILSLHPAPPPGLRDTIACRKAAKGRSSSLSWTSCSSVMLQSRAVAANCDSTFDHSAVDFTMSTSVSFAVLLRPRRRRLVPHALSRSPYHLVSQASPMSSR
jgi:hypothetical protein